MGYKFQVYAWVESDVQGYHYVLTYEGNSLIQFLRAAWEARRTSACIKMYWRE